MNGTVFSPRLLKAGPGAAVGKGRGVFATTEIARDDLVDACPCIDLDPEDCARILDTVIDDYYFRHPGDGERGLLVLGLASLCNHSDDPNTETRYEQDPRLGWIVTLIATRTIRPGEEVTRRYACPPWFAART